MSEEKTYGGVNQADAYQLYAYGTKYKECKNLYLIYPKDNEIQSKRYEFIKRESEQYLLYRLLKKQVL